jgi:hypothetical protein
MIGVKRRRSIESVLVATRVLAALVTKGQITLRRRRRFEKIEAGRA